MFPGPQQYLSLITIDLFINDIVCLVFHCMLSITEKSNKIDLGLHQPLKDRLMDLSNAVEDLKNRADECTGNRVGAENCKKNLAEEVIHPLAIAMDTMNMLKEKYPAVVDMPNFKQLEKVLMEVSNKPKTGHMQDEQKKIEFDLHAIAEQIASLNV